MKSALLLNAIDPIISGAFIAEQMRAARNGMAATGGDAAIDWAEDTQQVSGSTAASNSTMMFAFLNDKCNDLNKR